MAYLVGVVEDDEAVRELLSILCSTHGLSVRAYASAEAFWNELPAQELDCALVDIDLPGMSGLELVKKLRAAHITVPVIVVSGRASLHSALATLSEYSIDFLAKPFDNQVLLARITQLMGRTRDNAQLS